MPDIEKINKGNYVLRVGGSKGVYVLEFRSPFCPMCQRLQPVMDEISDLYSGRAGFGAVDVTEDLDIAAQYGIMQIPVLVFLRDGEEQKRLVGNTTKEEITAVLEGLLG